MSTFINLPESIEKAISTLLTQQGNTKEWTKRAALLHDHYMAGDPGYLRDFTDVLAYLAMRSPATYAQTQSALLHIQEIIPSFKPLSMLDIGGGPGVGVWAAKTTWPEITTADIVDQNTHMLSAGEHIMMASQLPINSRWMRHDLTEGLGVREKYDLIIIGNILNELNQNQRQRLLENAFKVCKGVVVILEPGTPIGSNIVESAAKEFATTARLVAPYIDNSFVQKEGFWLHFSQRFLRPEFQRRVRQNMRDDQLSSSNVEEAKFSFVAIGKVKIENIPWGRCVGNIEKQKGFLEVPILTKNDISTIKVMKRHKTQYNYAKELRWGQLINNKEDIVYPD